MMRADFSKWENLHDIHKSFKTLFSDREYETARPRASQF